MLPDFTPEIALEGQNLKTYKILRPILYGTALLAALYVASLVLFPSQYFTFDFLNPNSNKNTILNPLAENGASLDHGRFSNEKSTTFFAPVTEKYSSAIISFSLSSKSDPLSSGTVNLKKSFQAFFYPEGKPLGFKDGTLLQAKGGYFIVSRGELRQFSPEALVRLGFSKNSFVSIKDEELKHNPLGKMIGVFENYPDGSLFEIAGNNYILENGKLRPFLSEQAFLSQYDYAQLISKKEDFLKNYELSTDKIGFADGTLLSSPDSIFIVSGGKILPVDSEITFLSNGFFWENVVSASSDELSFYEKGKLFTLASPHPNGTAFFATDEKAWYLVKDGQRLRMPSEKIGRSWAKQAPVNVSQKGMGISSACQLQKNIWPLRSYSCRIQLENFQNIPGKDFRFETSVDPEIKVDRINSQFNKDATYSNFISSLSLIFNRVKNNYAGN